jgi:hypothetical protein
MTSIGPTRIRLAAGLALIAVLCCGAATALAFDSGKEQRNFSKTHERSRYDFLTPDFQAALAQRFTDNIAEELEIQTTDPERSFSGNICGHRSQECAERDRLHALHSSGPAARAATSSTGARTATTSAAARAAT